MRAKGAKPRKDLGLNAIGISGSGIWMAIGLAVVSAAIESVLLLTEATLQPPASDLTVLATFLAISGGSTVVLGLALRKLRFPIRLRSLRTRLIWVTVLTTTLALVNVGFTAFLMSISGHDLALLAGLLGFLLVVSVFVASAITEPAVRSLRGLIVAVAVAKISGGDLKVRVPVESEDEIGELAVSINDMAAKLETSLDKERELIQSRRELVSAVSHHLRTPLASIWAMVESLVDGVYTIKKLPPDIYGIHCLKSSISASLSMISSKLPAWTPACCNCMSRTLQCRT